MIEFIQFLYLSLNGSSWEWLIILFLLIFLYLILKISFLELIFLYHALKLLLQLGIFSFQPFALVVYLISLSSAFRIIHVLFIHDQLSVLIKLECQILDHPLFLVKPTLWFLFDRSNPLLIAIRDDLCLFFLNQDFILEVSYDDLQIDLTIIHDDNVIGIKLSIKRVQKSNGERFVWSSSLTIGRHRWNLELTEHTGSKLDEIQWGTFLVQLN